MITANVLTELFIGAGEDAGYGSRMNTKFKKYDYTVVWLKLS